MMNSLRSQLCLLLECAVTVSLVSTGISACSTDPGFDGRSSKSWIEQLSSNDPDARMRAAESLGQILTVRPDSREAVEALVLALADSVDAVRLASATALTTEGVDIGGAAEGFHAILHDSAHADVRGTIVTLAGALGPSRGESLVPLLSEALNDLDAGVRSTAVEALTMLGDVASPQLPAIVRLAADSSSVVRVSVVRSLTSLHAGSVLANRIAGAALGDSVASVRSAAAYTLATFGAAASPSLPGILSALSDPEPTVRAAAAVAASAIGGQAFPALPALRRLAADPSPEVARRAANAITAIESRGR